MITDKLPLPVTFTERWHHQLGEYKKGSRKHISRYIYVSIGWRPCFIKQKSLVQIFSPYMNMWKKEKNIFTFYKVHINQTTYNEVFGNRYLRQLIIQLINNMLYKTNQLMSRNSRLICHMPIIIPTRHNYIKL